MLPGCKHGDSGRPPRFRMPAQSVSLFFLCLLLWSSHSFAQHAEDKDVVVEDEGEGINEGKFNTEGSTPDLDDEEEAGQLGPSPYAETDFLFTDPPGSLEFIGGKLAKMLVGFYNSGTNDFVVLSMEASLRYPTDHTYYIHNYTVMKYETLVSPITEATFEYMFMPFESLSGRSFGLVVNLNYKQNNGKQFASTVFNDTITINEEVSNFNAETVFLYVVFSCLVCLVVILAYQFIASRRRKMGLKKRTAVPVEMGTSNAADIDFEWIPKEALLLGKSTAKTSPRRRKNERAETAGEG
uniref:Translocon-associated protein subunit alpha n=1 Tax=Trichuris muris TaxID=70415 RepID=A0A5S6QUD2_TRIMR